ncbi:hypothetical protein OG535_37120 [Kitasatospora sp. NBC_00085]|uniref:hypothetical protein n=1 Tax=unclassified Kitasatospora TaxID=2633591 RepID=UPI00324F4C6A
MGSAEERHPAPWTHFLGGPAPYPSDVPGDELAVPVNPFEWLREHRWPPKRPSAPRPVLTPEEFSEIPLTSEQRQRRAELLARVREANHLKLR